MGPAIRRLRLSVAMLLAIVAMGVVGYRLIEDFSLFDALYQTVLTLSTFGFQELQPLSDGARAFTNVLAALGVGGVFYLLTTVARLVLEGELKRDVEAWRMGRRIGELRNHFVVRGAGRVGAEVARAMVQRDERFVMIDSDEEALDALNDDWLSLHGDASNNEVLALAGIAHARSAIVATRSDAENTFITLTVRAMNPSCYIAARERAGLRAEAAPSGRRPRHLPHRDRRPSARHLRYSPGRGRVHRDRAPRRR